jgi:hypothetical protein
MRAFIGRDTQPVQAIEDFLLSACYKTLLVGVFDAQDKIAAMLAGEHPVEERGARSADV